MSRKILLDDKRTRRLKMRKSLVTNAIALFLIFNIFTIIAVTFFIKWEDDNKALKYAESTMEEIVKERSQLISIQFNRIESQAQTLSSWLEEMLNNPGLNVSDKLSDEYEITDSGIIQRRKAEDTPTSQSSLFVPNNIAKSPDLYREINFTELLDPSFAKILSNEDITWIYIATSSELIRCSPYRDLSSYFDSGHKQTSDVFFTVADKNNNPKGLTRWTKPYTDYLGTGWTMTCSQPIYRKDGSLYGVLSLDLSIDKVRKKYLNKLNLGHSGKIFWLDSKGNIYYHSKTSEEPKSQGKVFDKNIFRDLDISEEESTIIRKALKRESGYVRTSGKNSQILTYSKVKGTDTYLFIEMDLSDFLSQNILTTDKLPIIFIINFAMIIILSVIMYFRYAKPLRVLIGNADKISRGSFDSLVVGREDGKEFYEITELNKAFNHMLENIQEHTKTLLSKNREINTIIDSIDSTLMIVDCKGNIKLQSKDVHGIRKEDLISVLDILKSERTTFKDRQIVDHRFYENTYYPIYSGNGHLEKVVISSEDVTDKELMQKEVEQLEKMAGVGQLSAAIVHELKNALTRIKGAAYVIGIIGSESIENEVKTISKATEDAENVITTLLDFSKRDSNGEEMVHVPTLISQILLMSKKELIGRNISTEVDLDDDAYVFSNGREAMKVILQNIFINAVQAIDTDGHIFVKCSKTDAGVKVVIKDDGGGLKIGKDKLFEPFQTTKESGVGIGLWISKRLVEGIKGTIEVDSEEGVGTTFSIFIPADIRKVAK